MKSYELQVNGEYYQVDVLSQKSSQLTLTINGKEVVIDLLNVSGNDVMMSTPTVSTYTSTVSTSNTTITPPTQTTSPSSGSGTLTAPIPGKVSSILVSTGDSVTSGQKIMVMEAMKMENEIYADHDGVISEIFVQVGDVVSSGQPLIKY